MIVDPGPAAPVLNAPTCTVVFSPSEMSEESGIASTAADCTRVLAKSSSGRSNFPNTGLKSVPASGGLPADRPPDVLQLLAFAGRARYVRQRGKDEDHGKRCRNEGAHGSGYAK